MEGANKLEAVIPLRRSHSSVCTHGVCTLSPTPEAGVLVRKLSQLNPAQLS
jgi:hypothetical protein